MRRIYSIALVTILLANGVGFYIYFYFRLVEIKREMQAEIARTSPELFQKIILSLDEYNKYKEGDDELEWQDSMYDIAAMNINGDRVEIFALQDEFETSLLAFISGVIQFSGTDSKTPPSIFTEYQLLSFTIPVQTQPGSLSITVEIEHNTKYKIMISSLPLTAIAHPPCS